MKNLITYLKALWSRVADSQRNDSRNDRRHDCRLTVGSPSGLDAKWMLKLVSVLVLILTIGIGNAWGATATLSASCFKSNESNYNTSEASITDENGNTWKVKGYGMVQNKSVTLGKGNANYLQTPNFSGNISKIVVTCSGSYYLKVVDTDGNEVCAQQAASGSPLTFNVSGSYTQLRLFSKRSSGTSNAATTITNVVVTYGSSCSTKPTVSSSLSSVSSTVNSITATVPISSIGGCNITENGLVYSTSVATPEVGAANCSTETTTACGGTAANKTVTISGLTCGQSYYVRGYATNGAGTSYTNVTAQSTSACPKYTVTLKDDNSTLTQASAGASVTLPSRDGCSGYTFAGWTKTWVAPQSSWTTTAPTIIEAGSYTPEGNENLYPVYTKTESGGSPEFSQYQQVALGGTITAGKYLISTGSYTMAGSGKTGVSLTPGTTEAAAREYTVAIVSGTTITIKGPDNKYIGGLDKADGLTFSTTTPSSDDYRWVYTTNGIQNKSITGRHIKAYSTTDFRHYGTGNGTLTYFYKRIETAGTTTYYISVPNCCTPLGSINGSVSCGSGTTATLTWDAVTGAESYKVKVPGSSNCNDWTTATSGFSVNGLTAGQNYTAYFKAFDSNGTHCAEGPESTKAFTTPKITVTGTPSAMVYIYGNGPSTAESFTVSAVGMAGDITIAAPANFQVSKTSSTSGFANSVTLSPSSGTVSSTTIYVRMIAGLAVGSYGPSNIAISGNHASSVNVSVSGTVSPACEAPTINTQPAATANYNLNATATALTVAATKNGTGPALTYQWYSNTANSMTTPAPTLISGATSSSYTPPTTAIGMKYYFCEVSSGACSVTTSISAVTVNTPSITVSETSRAFGDRAVNPENPYYTMTFTVSGSNLAKDAPIALALSGANAGMFSINKTSISQTSAGSVSSTTVTVTYNPTAVGSHSATITISSSGATNKTVSLSGTAKYTVTWMSNGVAHHSDLVASGKPTFPTNPSSCDATSTTFYGWATAEWDDKIQSLAGKTVYTEASAMPNVSGNVTYYAVFAKSAGGGVTTILSEEFDNEQTTDATAAITSSTFANFSGATDKAYKSGTGGIKFGTGSVIGYITSKSLDLSSPFSVTLDCAKYGSDGANISVTIDGTTTQTIANSNFGTGKTLDFAAATASSTIKISTVGVSSKYRAYIDNVIVTKGSPATYSDYLTNCCTEWSAPTLSYTIPSGWKNGDSDIDASLGSGTTHGSATWTSSDESVLTVNGSGRIHAVGAGTATVTVTWAGDGTYCEQSQTSATITVSGNVTVVFDKNGGTGTDDQTQSVPYNTATALKTLAQVGYTAPSCKEFYGWADSQAKADAGTRDYTDGQSVTLTTGKTLYAVWKTITYTVTKGTCTTGTFSLSPASSIDCNGTITVTGTPDASHKGDPIVSISPADAGSVSGASITNVSKNITVNVEFAAKDVYTITWSSPAGTTTSNITEGEEIGTELPSNPVSCDAETYTNFVGWYAYEAGSQSDPTDPATFASAAGDKVTASTIPTRSVTYYAVFSDGDPDGWSLVTSASELVDGGEYTLGSKNSLENASLNMMGTWNSGNNIPGVAYSAADFDEKVRTFTLNSLTGYLFDAWEMYETTAEKYLYQAGGSSGTNNYLKLRASNTDGAGVWSIEINSTTYAATITAHGGSSYNDHNVIRWNTSGMFSCYQSGSQQDVYLYKKGGSGTGYISTCGISVKVTNGTQHITSANGIWTASNAITVEGQRLTSSGSANKRIMVSSDNANFKIRAASTQDAGNANAVLPYSSPQTYITTDSWSGTFEVTYTPTSANTTESATITVKVCNQNSSTALAQKTFTVYGRSLPANFLIAVNDGTLAEGHWFAVPADMIAPYGSSCSSGLGTYKPIPITVDNNTNPTKATIAPARAVYQPAERSTPRTSPQTLRFKSKTLSGSTIYYLYGGGTGGEGATNNTHIQNASFDNSEKQKWFLETEDLQKYNVHLAAGISPNVLGYTTAGGNNKVGQYSSGSATTKKDIWFLPFDVSECVYIPAPEVTGVSLNATSYTIEFPKDRLATDWQISKDGGSNWVTLPGKSELACSGSIATPTTVQGVLPMDTYRGETVQIKVSSPSSTCGTKIGEFTVPNPVITVNGSKPWHLYGITDAAFDDQSQTITLSGIYEGAGAETTVSSSNAEITASLVAPVTNGDVHVRLQMSAANATEGNHTTTLTFNSTGAETKTVEVIITMQSLAPQSFTKLGGYFSGDILCKNNDLSSSTTYAFKLTNPAYKSAGVVCETNDFNHSNMYLYDVATGERLEQSFPRTIDGSGVVQFSFSNLIAYMVEGKKYRIEWINTDLAVKNSSGVPYQDVSYTFTYGDCSKPIATPACPVSKTGFTANWIPSGSNTQTFNAYYYELGATICDVTYTSNDPVPTHYYSQASNSDNTDPVFFGMLYGASWSSPSSTMFAWQSDSYGGWRICNTSKRFACFSKACSTAGTYTVTFNGRAITNNNSVTIYKTDQNGEPIGSNLGVYELSSSGITTVTLQVTLASGQRIAVVPDLMVSGSKGVVAVKGLSVKQVGAKHYVGSTPASGISSSINSREVTGLTAGTTYYYTINNGSESNEITVTTRSDDPVIDFSPAKAVLQTDVNGSTSTPISLDGTNLTLCDLTGAISGTNASYFGYDLSDAVYNQITGALSGTLVITYHPTTTGNHTATFTIDGVSLDLEGHACPANYGTMATAATAVTKNSATANWSQSTTGYLMLAENSRVDDELLLNGGFEDDGLDWDGVPNTMLPSSGSRSNELNAAMKKTGSKGLYVRAGGNGSYLYPYNVTSGTGVMGGAVYSAKRTLPAGTYTISCYVHGASNASSLSAFPNSDQNFYVGFAVDCPSNMYASARRSINPVTGTNVKNQSGWVQVTGTFTLEEPTSGYIFLCNSTSGSNHAADDFSLKYTAAGHGNNFTEYPITSAISLALTDLKPHTSYSYYVMNSDGCESNIIDFTTTDSDDPISITADPNPVNLIAAIGSTAKQTVVISEENAYSSILLSVGDCGGRISVSPTSLGATGGVAVVSFTPLPGDEMGDNGTCTISATTLGLGLPSSITVNWSVAAGYDMNTPTIEVTDITNSSITVEHNIEIGEDSEMRIQLDRELSEDEIEENVGDEIFFSKYYEAYSHKKILAIYNPTNEKISLKGTYIWRSKNDYSDWNRETGISLVNYGKETGFIGPQEEIIFYNSQLSYTCEQTKTDMSEWAGTTDQAISYDGDDAFLLVRKVRTGEADYRTPPAESVEEDGMGNPIPLTWRTIVDDDETEWTMLDLIGARAKNNMPDGSGVQGRWSWRNCKTSTTESGDEKGWVGYGYDVNDDSWSSNTCNSQPAGYLLSTNRCLLLRRYTVKSGNNAVSANVGDMNTLGKNAIQSEWKGAHVPTEGDQEAVSCENFSFVGGYDYANYYNAWTPLGEGDYVVGDRNSDGSYTVTDINVPKYWCNKLRVEIIEKQTVNGVEVENVRLYEDYKVPIVINTNTTTNTASFFGNPNNPTYSGAEDNAKKDAWRTACADCDIVIRDNAKLEHVTSGVSGFNNMTIYPGAKFDNSTKLGFTLNGLQIQALNDNVGYAIINDNGSTITADNIVHVKRIDDQYWYPFSLPYDCEITAIRQQNGKSMGEYWEDWGIKYYDGADRQAQGESAAAGANSKFWKQMPADGTLHANQAYIIGLFTTEWDGQIKNVYFPPKESSEYTEAGDDAKTTTISKWAAGYDASDDSKTRHYGWNFTASPYISMFGENVSGQGFNNTTNLIMGEIQNDGSYANTDYVYVSVPDGADSKTYTQVRATATTLEPFKGYFVQAKTNGSDGSLTLTYAKDYRTLSQAPARKATAQKQRVDVDLKAEGNGQSDIAGIVVDDEFTTAYEIGGDLTKMYATATKPQLYFLSQDNEKMAYIAIPDANAEDIPMELYAPKAGQYIISLNKRSSRTNGAESVELLYNGNVMTNLLIDSCTINANNKGVISGYSVRIRRTAQVITSMDLINGEHVTVITNNGQMSITNLPGDAKVFVYDMTGRLMSTGNADGESVVNIDAPQQGVYNVVVQSAAGKTAIRTIVR